MENLPITLSAILAIVLFTSFVKVLTVLSILRQSLGLGAGVGLAFAALAFVLSVLIVEPQLKRQGSGALANGLQGIFSASSSKDVDVAAVFTPFLSANTDQSVVSRLSSVRDNQVKKAEPSSSAAESGKPEAAEKDTSFGLLTAAFLITELREAFELGLIILLPFLVIDLLVVNLLMTLSITQMSHQTLSLALKILLFVAVDGWGLITQRLLGGYV